jgi:hypothetical protein
MMNAQIMTRRWKFWEDTITDWSILLNKAKMSGGMITTGALKSRYHPAMIVTGMSCLRMN